MFQLINDLFLTGITAIGTTRMRLGLLEMLKRNLVPLFKDTFSTATDT